MNVVYLKILCQTVYIWIPGGWRTEGTGGETSAGNWKSVFKKHEWTLDQTL